MKHQPQVLALSILLGTVAACSGDEAGYTPLAVEESGQASLTASVDSFQVWGYTYDDKGQVESEGSTYSFKEFKFVNFGTDSVRLELYETDQTYGGGDVYNGGWVDIDANIDGSWYALDRVEADLTMDKIFKLPAGAYARLEAREDLSKDCIFKYWRVDGVYSYDPVITHDANDGNWEHTVAFQCPSSSSSDEPPPSDCVDCAG